MKRNGTTAFTSQSMKLTAAIKFSISNNYLHRKFSASKQHKPIQITKQTAVKVTNSIRVHALDIVCIEVCSLGMCYTYPNA